MLSPAKMKFRKHFKGRMSGVASRGHRLSFGSFGLKALGLARISAAQIEAARRAITRRMKRVGKVWIRVYPDVPVTQKPAEVRMGSGKGGVEYWACRVYPGTILFEMDGVDPKVAMEALELASAKLPVLTKIISRGA
jgi:large subunit ribosomal protein L16